MKVLLLLLLCTATSLAIGSAPGSVNQDLSQGAAGQREPDKPPFTLPANIKLILSVEQLPGLESPNSFWEGAYEISVTDWRTVVDKTTAGEDIAEGRAVLAQSSFSRRSLADQEHRKLVVSIPINGSLRERLQQQPKNPQAFLLKSSVRLFDGKLDRNFALKVDRVWRFSLFLDGEATIAIRIKPDGSSSVWGPIPRELPPGYSNIGVQPPNKP